MNKLIRFCLLILVSIISFSYLNAQDITKYFPGNNEIPKWNRSGEMRTFANDKLWEYIDGGAENYYLYGFKKVITCDFKNSSKQIVLDIYEMGDPKNTFGIYASERDPRYNFLKVGVQGYLEGTSLNFWKGNCYVKITTFDKSAETKEALKQFGKAVEKKIPGSSSDPAFLNYFPKSNLISNSGRYFSKDILGHSFLNNGFVSEYKDGKNKYRVFLLDAGNIKSAQSSFTSYKNFITQAKGFEKSLKDIGNESFSGKESSKKIVVFYNSKMMGGTIGLDDEAKAIKILQEISKK
jgi:hypothetical protein